MESKGIIIHHIHRELLSPLLSAIAFCIADKIPKIPHGLDIEVELVGRFASRLKETDSMQLRKLYELLIMRGQAKQASPDIMSVAIDPIKESLFIANVFNVSPQIVRDAQEQESLLRQMMQQRKEEQKK